MSNQISEQTKTKIVDTVRKMLADQGINAFNRLSNSVKVEQNNNKIQVFALDYFFSSLFGRGKNQRNTGGLLAAVQAWVKLGKYGIDPNDKGIAYAIVRKIAAEGSYVFRNKGIQSKREKAWDDTVKTVVAEIVKEVGKVTVQNYADRVNKSE